MEQGSLRLLTFFPALLWICIFMNEAQEGLGGLDARQTEAREEKEKARLTDV